MEQAIRAKPDASSDLAVFVAAGWIVLALLLSPLFRVHWFAPGDFSYSGAMYYHAIMVPVLILLYLLIIKILSLNVARGRAYGASAILCILFVGVGSIFNTSKGVSTATVVQIIGMVMADGLGIVLVVAMAKWVVGEHKSANEAGTAVWLLFTSLMAILVAAPLGHLAAGVSTSAPRPSPVYQRCSTLPTWSLTNFWMALWHLTPTLLWPP